MTAASRSGCGGQAAETGPAWFRARPVPGIRVGRYQRQQCGAGHAHRVGELAAQS